MADNIQMQSDVAEYIVRSRSSYDSCVAKLDAHRKIDKLEK
jgi:hypothetical protein